MIGSRLLALFKPSKEKLPAGDVAWSESLLYGRGDWPKYNPDDLIGRKGFGVYRKMMNDEQVKAVVKFKRDAVTSRRWYFEIEEELPDERAGDGDSDGDDGAGVGGSGGDDSDVVVKKPDVKYRRRFSNRRTTKPQDEGLKTRLCVMNACLEQMEGSPIDAFNGIMSAMYHGFSMTEKVFKQIETEGKTWWGIERLRLKPYNTFYFHSDPFGNLRKVTQKWEGYEQPINMEKFIHHVYNKDVDEHYGQSELREAYRAWFSKEMVIRFWNIFLERHANGFLFFRPKEGSELRAGTTQYNDLVNLITNLSAKTAALLPSNIEVDFHSPANNVAFPEAVAEHNSSMAKALLVPNLLGVSEQGKTGAYSQSQTQLEAFLWTLEQDARRLEEVLNEQLFKPLAKINFGEEGPYPCFRFNPISETMKYMIVAKWKELVQGGAVEATDTDEAHVRELMDFPDKGEPISKPKLVDPVTGMPLPGNMPPTQRLPGQPKKPIGKPDETVAGRERVAIERARIAVENAIARGQAAFSRAEKRVDFAVIDNKTVAIQARGIERATQVVRDGVAAIKRMLSEENVLDNPDKVADVQMPARMVSKLNRIIGETLQDAWNLGHEHARREIEKAIMSMTRLKAGFAAPDLKLLGDAAERAKKFLESRAYSAAGDISDNVRRKITTIIYNGIKGSWPLSEIEARIEDEVGVGVLPHLATGIRTVTFESLNEARYDLFTSSGMAEFVEALEYSAILDGKTTVICQSLNGQIYPANSDVWDTYRPPNHFNCRSLLVAVTTLDNWRESPAPKVDPQDGFA